MNRKNSPQLARVREIKQYKNQKQSIEYQALIKRQSTFFSRWKERRALLVYIPNQEFSLTLFNKNKSTIDQMVNLNLTRVSKRCSIVQQHYCFGLELKSGKRYLLSGSNQAQVIAAFELIAGIKRLLKQPSQISTSSNEKQRSGIIKQKQQLQFQKSNDDDEERFKGEKQELNIKMVSTNCSPFSQNYQREYEKEEQKRQQIEMEMQRQSDYCTVLQEQPIILQQQPQAPLHLKVPLQKQQLQYLESDQNFKLIENFNQGRILQKNKKIIKANLVFKTHLTSEQLLESFFHLELWNQKVKNYQLRNRIDEGIYVVQVEFNKKSMFSSPRRCFMMVTTLIINKERYLIMKSLDQNVFQQKKGTQWLNCSIWLKVRGEDNQKMNRFVSLCAAVQHQRDFQQILAFFLQIKFYQSFLLTTNKLPNRVLEWRKEEENQIFIR